MWVRRYCCKTDNFHLVALATLHFTAFFDPTCIRHMISGCGLLELSVLTMIEQAVTSQDVNKNLLHPSHFQSHHHLPHHPRLPKYKTECYSFFTVQLYMKLSKCLVTEFIVYSC